MAQIRSSIELLTKLFRENGASKIKAETFRLAKFNQGEATECLWRLLFELLYYCEYGKIDDITIRAQSHLTSEELVVYVKRDLQERGFHSRHFLALDGTMSTGSRELLLALGWLMCKEGIIEKFMRNCTSPLDDDTSSLHKPQDDGDAPSVKNQLSAEDIPRDPVGRVHQLLWLNHKLRFSLRSLHSLQREKNTLKHKIHEATQGVSLSPDKSHLSMLEVYMLRNPQLLKKNFRLLERDNERLQNLLKWKDHEEIFWKWMESVLDAKLKEDSAEASKRRQEGFPENSPSLNITPDTAAVFQDSHHNLRDAIIKYEAIVDHLERLWNLKSSDVSEEELDSVLASIELELAIQKASIALGNTHDYIQRHNSEDPSFVYEKKISNQQPAHIAPGLQDETGSLQEYQEVQKEIASLNALVEKLEQEVEDKQAHFKEEMQTLSEKFRDAVCIPPMGQKR